MLLPNRNGSNDSYRYGFNGMEKDDEVKGSGNSYTTYFRQYDPRLGTWLTRDPESSSFAHLTPYNAFANNPILFIDGKGDKFVIPENLSKSEKILIQYALEILKAASPKVYKELEDHETIIKFAFEDIPDSAADKFSKGNTRLTWVYTGGLKAAAVKRTRPSGGTFKDLDFEATLDVVMKKTGDSKYEEMWNEYYDDPNKGIRDLIKIDESIAEKLLRIENNEVTIVFDEKLKNDLEELAKTSGHENGHTYYSLFNKPFAAFSKLLHPKEVAGHNTNKKNEETHPDGNTAFLIQKQIEVFKNLKPAEYKAILKKYKELLKEAKKEEKADAKKNKG